MCKCRSVIKGKFKILAVFPGRGRGNPVDERKSYPLFLVLAMPYLRFFFLNDSVFMVLSASKNDRRKYHVKKDETSVNYQHETDCLLF